MQAFYTQRGKPFSNELFENPPAEYRGTPFWSWNNILDVEQLKRQIEIFKKMGFGGAHIHSRTGMATPYMSEEFLEIVKSCIDKLEQEGMLGWLYDEDRWPSGSAGGLVTENENYRARHLLITRHPYGSVSKDEYETSMHSQSTRNENGLLLGVYSVTLDGAGRLESYSRIDESSLDKASGDIWYVYIEKALPTSWFNNCGYGDTLNPEAMARFIEVTHERYYNKIGDKFGKTVPAIFTDEPQFSQLGSLHTPYDENDLVLPFTDTFPNTYRETYGYDFLDKLPEALWECADKEYSTVRYHFHQHICERFNEAYCDQIGEWCEKHNIMLTGHMMFEPTLMSQSESVGDCMRAYEHFQLPGIDMLCAWMEYTTAKQAQSVSRQYGRLGVLSELYGVTGWDYDFANHKHQGDWQAALGVTIRVPHLSWVSMEGEAKRDFPASISYQSPWWKKYGVVEDYFARTNYAMTRGKAICNIGVIHPVESYWINCGPNTQTAAMREELDSNFQNLTKWLLYGFYDFDFISESLLPRQKTDFSDGDFELGEMKYKVILVPGMQTIRSTTLDKLEEYVAKGGKVQFIGNIPRYVDVVVSDRAEKLAEKCQCVSFGHSRILEALEKYREVCAKNTEEKYTSDLLYQLRSDGSDRYLFICNTNFDNQQYTVAGSHTNLDHDNILSNVEITIKGNWKVEILDTQSAKVTPIDTELENNVSKFYYTFYPIGSLLLRLTPATAADSCPVRRLKYDQQELQQLSSPVKVTIDEPNVLLLDQAEWRFNGGELQPLEELLRLENRVRESSGLSRRSGVIAQPWTEKKDTTELGEVELIFNIDCRHAVKESWLAIENAAKFVITFDDRLIDINESGWWVDECIRKYPIGGISEGVHKLSMRCKVNDAMALEWCYILGDFGVGYAGRSAWITAPVRSLVFGDYTIQGLPFYSGNVTYHCEADIPQTANIMRIPHFNGAMVSVVDSTGSDHSVAYPPYECPVTPGDQKYDITLWGTRENSFGCLHRMSKDAWIGPAAWREVNNQWSYEYTIKPTGILSSPRILSVTSS